MTAKLLLLSFGIALASSAIVAQSPTPIIVQAITPGATPQRGSEPAPVPTDTSASTLRLLQELKTANEAILAKQAATLQQLEELEKAAEQIKIYSKRG